MHNPKLTKALRGLDYAAGAATVGYGLATLQPLVIGLGVAGLALAYLNLSDRIASALRSYFGRKSAKPVVPAAPVLEGEVSPASAPVPPPAAAYGALRMQVGPGLASSSRHSRLKSAAHLNLATAPQEPESQP